MCEILKNKKTAYFTVSIGMSGYHLHEKRESQVGTDR